jgi:hypothetical protein
MLGFDETQLLHIGCPAVAASETQSLKTSSRWKKKKKKKVPDRNRESIKHGAACDMLGVVCSPAHEPL